MIDQAEITAIIRHVLTMVGGMAVSAGYLTSDQMPQVVGALVVLGSVVWSIWQKGHQKQAVADALAAPAPQPQLPL